MKRGFGFLISDMKLLIMLLVCVTSLSTGCTKQSDEAKTTAANVSNGETTWTLDSSEGDWCVYKSGRYTNSIEKPAGGCAATMASGI
jgi:hypothetical protein